jgi:hypothetical protein
MSAHALAGPAFPLVVDAAIVGAIVPIAAEPSVSWRLYGNGPDLAGLNLAAAAVSGASAKLAGRRRGDRAPNGRGPGLWESSVSAATGPVTIPSGKGEFDRSTIDPRRGFTGSINLWIRL